MKRKGLFALLTSLSAMSALLFALSPAAQAVDPGRDVVACVFNGATSALEDIDKPEDDAADPSGDGFWVPDGSGGQTKLPTNSVPGDLLDVEDGGDNDPTANDYVFDTAPAPVPVETQCVHLDSDGVTQELVTEQQGDDTGVYDAEIHAEGTYQNLICGTGSTNGNATLTINQNNPANVPNPVNTEADSVSADYFIMFTAGQGVGAFTGNVVKAGNPDRSALGTTLVDIRPQPRLSDPPNDSEGCVTDDVTDFDVTGIVIGTTDAGLATPTISPILAGFKDGDS